MRNILQDMRYGIRLLLKNRGFTFVAVLTLCLGIGANTAIFSVVNAVLLRPLPFAEPERLTLVWNRGVEAAGGDRTPLAVADLLDWRSQNHAFESVDAYQNAFYNYTDIEPPERVLGAAVTAGFFATLGAGAQLGRTFAPDEDRSGAERVVVISHRFWRKHFNADPEAIGRAITLSGTSFTIVGVMPDGFDFPRRTVELWTALQLPTPTRRGPYFLHGVARLKPAVTPDDARADASLISSTFSGEKLDFNVLPVNEFITGDVRPALIVLLVAVTLVLLIASANVANLLLVRAAGREKEISIRSALGASRSRIIRQLLTESLLLALAGGFAGVLLAMWGVELLVKLAPENLPRLDHIKIDLTVLGWTALVSVVTGTVFGLVPAVQSSRLNLNESLKEGGRSSTESAGRRRWRDLLVISELAMALMLLVGAGLLIKSFWRLQQVDLGINPKQVLTMEIALRGAKYPQSDNVSSFYGQLVERVEALPGVQAVAVSNSLPPDQLAFSSDFAIEGRPVDPGESAMVADFPIVSGDYFQALGLPLRRGRFFSETDSRDAPRVVLINETMERRFFSGEDPVGRRLNLGSQREPAWAEIVGVVGDAKYTGVESETQPAIYQPSVQNPSWGMFLVVKTESGDPLSLATAVRNEVRALDRELPVRQIRTMEQLLAASLVQPRFRTTLITIFALLALALASVGIYGVISYTITQRTHEIGIRMALGARPADVMKLLLKQAVLLTASGVGVGLIASLALTRLMESILFRVTATDPVTFILIALMLVLVALAACYVPARRATRLDPMNALRYE